MYIEEAEELTARGVDSQDQLAHLLACQESTARALLSTVMEIAMLTKLRDVLERLGFPRSCDLSRAGWATGPTPEEFLHYLGPEIELLSPDGTPVCRRARLYYGPTYGSVESHEVAFVFYPFCIYAAAKSQIRQLPHEPAAGA